MLSVIKTVSTLQTYSIMQCYLLLRHGFDITDTQYYAMLSVIKT
jgi:hypothetical protein